MTVSFEEALFYEYFRMLMPEEEIIQGDHEQLAGKELDLWFPGKGFAVEVGSWFIHSQSPRADANKRRIAKRKGIHLVSVLTGKKEGMPKKNGTPLLAAPSPQSPDVIWSKHTLDRKVSITKFLQVAKPVCDALGVQYRAIPSDDWQPMRERAMRRCDTIATVDVPVPNVQAGGASNAPVNGQVNASATNPVSVKDSSDAHDMRANTNVHANANTGAAQTGKTLVLVGKSRAGKTVAMQTKAVHLGTPQSGTQSNAPQSGAAQTGAKHAGAAQQGQGKKAGKANVEKILDKALAYAEADLDRNGVHASAAHDRSAAQSPDAGAQVATAAQEAAHQGAQTKPSTGRGQVVHVVVSGKGGSGVQHADKHADTDARSQTGQPNQSKQQHAGAGKGGQPQQKPTNATNAKGAKAGQQPQQKPKHQQAGQAKPAQTNANAGVKTQVNANQPKHQQNAAAQNVAQPQSAQAGAAQTNAVRNVAPAQAAQSQSAQASAAQSPAAQTLDNKLVTSIRGDWIVVFHTIAGKPVAERTAFAQDIVRRLFARAIGVEEWPQAVRDHIAEVAVRELVREVEGSRSAAVTPAVVHGLACAYGTYQEHVATVSTMMNAMTSQFLFK